MDKQASAKHRFLKNMIGFSMVTWISFVLGFIASPEYTAGEPEHPVKPFLYEYVFPVKFHCCLYDVQMYKTCHEEWKYFRISVTVSDTV